MTAVLVQGVLAQGVLAAEEQLPEDVGKSGPLGLFLVLVLLVAAALLVKSMSGHLKRLPRSFDAPDDDGPAVVVPDTPAELVDRPRQPGQDLLDTLRRAPRAIEGPRPERGDGGRTDPPAH
ncbi:hypothetical protein SAMN05660690_1687 [Geodermatophilus telluris]|uniref:Uncharacterized protein n=1 Tax=Geodermatophilus telluris TaxID=1190417 RepID=A0A1G6M5C5_9ACTN|nr:hypothetical protein [Geodermatophilus telluris]SDC50557.1 hypothetical protein SAMN05660690_1687 [Geodermatophilus telluris]